MYKVGSYFLTICFIACSLGGAFAQNHSIAREWNEELLEAIRNDFARPTIHARNLFHSSVAMYDAWAAYEPSANTFFLGKSLGNFNCPFEGIPVPEDKKAAQEEAISYAVYRLLTFRFQGSPNAAITQFGLNNLMEELGYDIGITSTNYQDGNPAHLGNYIGQQLQLFGFQDGSNELGSFENLFYEPVNPSLVMDDPGNDMVDPNRWQPLSLSNFVDQAGNPIDEAPGFLSPEWGYVVPFAMQESDRAIYTRDGFDYPVWNDPGVPPLLDPDTPSGLEDNFKWGFTLVSVWASHLDPSDGVLWDISPASIGNIPFEDLPQNFDEHPDFYNYLEGGDISPGHSVNPKTGLPYEPQIVPRGDYARILAEFWADGPDSETPPGHWFVITNYVSDNPALEKRWKGEGPILDDLEWDVKSYFTLGGAMHDAAISAWSNKGYYDYVRPVSVVRYLAELGQSSDPALPNYHPGGMPLVPGKIELVEAGDPLAGANNEHVNKVKLYTWRGPDFIANEATDVAGVGWILAENWWPYQRPTFVTPPFAGYVSGHSTYSRAAAETLTRITGDPYFPGGLGEFPAPQNEFLVFEDGPSVDVTLQWATYRDASDQCSLSRIWGGIHPPADDIPGRQIGEKVGNEAFDYADLFIGAQNPEVVVLSASDPTINTENTDQELVLSVEYDRAMNTMVTPTLVFATDNPADVLTLATNEWTSATTFTWRFTVEGIAAPLREPVVQITGAEDESGKTQEAFAAKPFQIDLQRPVVMQFTANNAMLADADVQTNALN
ncbi:MAG: vanadium-dependent haloperoxidase, partial [Bacteroidota bacterium]